MRIFQKKYLLIFLILLTACGSKREAEKALRQRQCPQIYVLNKADVIEKKAPGFERTDKILYRISFDEIRDICKVGKKKTKISFQLQLEFEKDGTINAALPPFSVFMSFLDDKKKPIWREFIPYQPQQWKNKNKLRVKNIINVSYPSTIAPPHYVYFGFATNEKELSEKYLAQDSGQ